MNKSIKSQVVILSKRTKTKRKIPSNKYGNFKNNMNKLVISINNDLGNKRRKKLNYKFKHIEGVTKSPKWIVDNLPNKKIGPFISECLVTGFYKNGTSVVLATSDKKIPNGSRLA